MTNSWIQTGVGDLEEVPLTGATREYIQTQFDAFGVPIDDVNGFYAGIEHAIAKFKVIDSLKEESKPSAVRKNLKSALESAYEFNQEINDLDANSRLLIASNYRGGISRLSEELLRVVDALSEASHAADAFPGKGRLHDHARTDFLRNMYILFVNHGFKPTTTKDGLFSVVLSAALEEATGKPVNTVHDLISKINDLDISQSRSE